MELNKDNLTIEDINNNGLYWYLEKNKNKKLIQRFKDIYYFGDSLKKN